MSDIPQKITIRPCASVNDYHACQHAQRRAWGVTDPSYLVPVATMAGAQLHGGLVLGAFLPDGQAVALSFAFLGRIDGRLGLYSQLTGVVPEFQGQGLGLRLKHAQRDWAAAAGLPLIAWAFDPMQAGNAHFNLTILGATCSRLIPDMYGPRTDVLNSGLPTDRLIAVWETDSHPPAPVSTTDLADTPILVALDLDPNAPPRLLAKPLDPTATTLRIQIPNRILDLQRDAPQLAHTWQSAVREAFLQAFAHAYRAVVLHRDDSHAGRRAFYVLQRPPESG